MNTSKINYMPYGKNILIKQYEKVALMIPKTNLNIVSMSDISDKELKEMGMISKGDMMASKGSEEQDMWEIVAVGPKVDSEEIKIGDKILLKGGAQVYGVTVDEKIYGQTEEFWVAGKMIL